MDGHPCFKPHFLNGVSLFPPCPPKCHTTKIRYDVVKRDYSYTQNAFNIYKTVLKSNNLSYQSLLYAYLCARYFPTDLHATKNKNDKKDLFIGDIFIYGNFIV